MSFEDITDEFDFDQFDSDQDLIGTEDDDGISIPLIRSVNESVNSSKSAGKTLPSDFEKEDTDAYLHVTGTVENIIEQPVVVQYNSKMDHARAIYNRELLKGPVVRKHLIQMFIKEAGCTPAGASTYYQTLNSKK